MANNAATTVLSPSLLLDTESFHPNLFIRGEKIQPGTDDFRILFNLGVPPDNHEENPNPPSYAAIVQADGPFRSSTSTEDILEQQPTLVDEKGTTESSVTSAQLLTKAIAWIPPATSPSTFFPPLPLPILIPRVHPDSTMPFARAWVPELAQHGFTQEEFLTFIDNLNIVTSPVAAFQLFKLASIGVGAVPHEWGQATSAALGFVASVGTQAVSYARQKAYLKEANERYFAPRGLHIQVVGTRRMRKLLGIGKKDPLTVPLSQDTLTQSPPQQYMAALEGRVCDITFEVPGPAKPTKLLARLKSWQIRVQLRKAEKESRKERQKAWKSNTTGKGKIYKIVMWGQKVKVSRLAWILIKNLSEES
jgi:hypothetical protein